MTNKELKAYFGHPFGPTKVFSPIENIDENFVARCDRSGNIIRIIPLKAEMLEKEIKHGFDTYSAEQWITRLNEKFRGQPYSTAKNQLAVDVKIFAAD